MGGLSLYWKHQAGPAHVTRVWACRFNITCISVQDGSTTQLVYNGGAVAYLGVATQVLTSGPAGTCIKGKHFLGASYC